MTRGQGQCGRLANPLRTLAVGELGLKFAEFLNERRQFGDLLFLFCGILIGVFDLQAAAVPVGIDWFGMLGEPLLQANLAAVQIADFAQHLGPKPAYLPVVEAGNLHAFGDRLGNTDQVFDPAPLRFVVDHHVKLTGEDQHSDATQHSLYHRRRHGSEPLAESKAAGENLQRSGNQHSQPQHLEPQPLYDVEDDHRQSRRRPADLQRHAA